MRLVVQCGSLQDVVWQCDWMAASRPTHQKLVLLTARAQRYNRDGLAAAGMQDRISMLTFVQVEYYSEVEYAWYQRYPACQGLSERRGVVTSSVLLVQVLRSSVSFLQALRNLK